VILPYIDMLWAAHYWPYPAKFRGELLPVIASLTSSGFVDLKDRDFYAAVRLKPEFSPMLEHGTLEAVIRKSLCMPPECLSRASFDYPTPHSHVGEVIDGQLVGNGVTGYVLFGPYVPMRDGQYKLVIRGTVDSESTGWIDVASSKGTVQHGKFALDNNMHANGVVAEEIIELDVGVEDLEVRVYLEDGGKITLDGYELRRLASANP